MSLILASMHCEKAAECPSSTGSMPESRAKGSDTHRHIRGASPGTLLLTAFPRVENGPLPARFLRSRPEPKRTRRKRKVGEEPAPLDGHENLECASGQHGPLSSQMEALCASAATSAARSCAALSTAPHFHPWVLPRLQLQQGAHSCSPTRVRRGEKGGCTCSGQNLSYKLNVLWAGDKGRQRGAISTTTKGAQPLRNDVVRDVAYR